MTQEIVNLTSPPEPAIAPAGANWGTICSVKFAVPFFSRPLPSAEAGPGELVRVERVISVARLFLAGIAVIALGFDPVEPPAYAPFARILLLLFTAHSISAVLVLRKRPIKAERFAITTYAVDVFAALMTVPLARHSIPFFAFFLFILASAAFRWGFRETMAMTGALAIIVMMYEDAANAFALEFNISDYDDPNRLIVRLAYIGVLGVLLGYLAEEGKLIRAESAAVVGLLAKIRADVNVSRVLTIVGKETAEIFNGSQMLLVVEELSSQRLFRWDTVAGWTLAQASQRDGAPLLDRPAYFFGSPDHSMAIVRHKWPFSSASYETLVLDPDGRLVDGARVTVPGAFTAAYPFKRLILAPVSFGEGWSGRLFIFEPRFNRHLIELTEFLQRLIRQVSPAVFSVYLQNRLQEKAGALERARVARELHDGVIQSLIGVEMQLEVLRTQKPLRFTPAGDELMRLQHLVREEVLNLRDLMQQMRPAEFDPEELLDHFADMVQRFGRDTGIRARFVTHLKAVSLERHVCFELVRIVQEGLANIRKHSAATHVVVKLDISNNAWRLEIGDDGRGFPFEGRLTQMELDARGVGPAIIKERVQAIGGQLTIDSTPGRGSRLEVLVPHESPG